MMLNPRAIRSHQGGGNGSYLGQPLGFWSLRINSGLAAFRASARSCTLSAGQTVITHFRGFATILISLLQTSKIISFSSFAAIAYLLPKREKGIKNQKFFLSPPYQSFTTFTVDVSPFVATT